METQVPVHPAQAALPAQFKEMRTRFTALVEAIPDHIYNRPPAGGGWSAGQVVQHLLLSAQGVASIQANGRAAATDRDPARQYAVLDAIFNNYELKYPSAENLVPQGDHFDKKQQLADMDTVLDALQNQIGQPGLGDEMVEFDIPVFGVMTRLEYIYLVTVHTNRHLRQIREAIA